MIEFKVGDRVRIKKNTPYSITTPGSEGVILEMRGDHNCMINFYKITNDKYSSAKWEIEIKHLEKIAPKIDDEGNII